MSLNVPPWMWISFAAALLALLALDLGAGRTRRARLLNGRPAAWRALLWSGLALIFGALVHRFGPPGAGGDFFGAYLKLLPIESVFVFAAVFSLLRVPRALQVRVVFWGVVGALVARGALLALGVELVEDFAWILPVFGVVLIAVGWRKFDLARAGHHVDLTPIKKKLWRALRVHDAGPGEHGDRFFVRVGAATRVTPLFLALVLIEGTDVVVALDVIPAVLSITTDPFLLFAANAFALLSFRSLYFLLAEADARLALMPAAVALGVMFAGIKLAASPWWKMPTELYLGAYATLLVVTAAVSLRRARDAAGTSSAHEP